MDYETFVRYTVYISMISLPRNELRDKVMEITFSLFFTNQGNVITM
jgi:hypothetical protein